jgi:hypothetical protein
MKSKQYSAKKLKNKEEPNFMKFGGKTQKSSNLVIGVLKRKKNDD